MKRALLAFAIMASMPAGCGGGSGTTPSPPRTIAASASIAYVSAAATGVQPAVQPTPLVLYDGQFLDFMESGYLLALQIVPAPQQQGPVSWNSSNSAAIALSNTVPFGSNTPGYTAPTAPPGQIYAQTGAAYGKSLISATAASPANTSASITAFHYASLSFGCRFRYEPAYAFDPDRAGLMQSSSNWTSADLYDTYPAAQLHQLDPCINTALAVSETAETWHMPYGGVVLPSVSLQAFTEISASQWTDAGTDFTPLLPSLVLFKTKEGRIVKALLPIGPYEVSGSDGTFPF